MKKFLILSIILILFPDKIISDTLSISDITNIKWEWNSIVLEDSTIFYIEESYKYHITFFDNGNLDGLADCNRAWGTYISKSANLTMKVATTRMGCGRHSSGGLFSFALNNSNSFKIKQNSLHILFESNRQDSTYKKGILIFHQ